MTTQTNEDDMTSIPLDFEIKQVESIPKLQGLLNLSDGEDLYNYLNNVNLQNTKTVTSSIDYNPIPNKEFMN